ncbi:RhuM family protein [Phreatobacter oligotrophus]|jgi:hypothetical protein|uniref:Bro-N domain-containing protein n=1 Tax=Phreatobacter oligotrophus TaxID=1122261 RepID=A0A2T4Z1J5_9HYPH|nr:RhuM family protein [Phreatobacter oligotrophus]PTM53594.1 hypothetical protein C8P69_106248 [Phreatobacter oligotrophus]
MTDVKKPSLKERVKSAMKGAISAVANTLQLDFFAKFKGEDQREIDFPIDITGETVWATQQQMAALFDVGIPAISKHISNVYGEGELERAATLSKLEIVQSEGGRSVTRSVDHYNLDMILAVGYRVSSKKATEFRKWASQVLKGYIKDGYALNGRRLSSDPAALLRLAQEVRALRTSEKAIYEQVREAFKMSAADYDGSSEEARLFFARSQDAFHYAASENTAAQIVLARCDAAKPNMGMTTAGNVMPTFADAKVAKNYLTSEELRTMQILGEQWLLYTESMSMRGKPLTMARLLAKLDELIGVHEYPVFPGYSGALAPRRDQHVREQLEIYRKLSRNLPAA